MGDALHTEDGSGGHFSARDCVGMGRIGLGEGSVVKANSQTL